MTKQRNEKPNDKVKPRSKQTKEIEKNKEMKKGNKLHTYMFPAKVSTPKT